MSRQQFWPKLALRAVAKELIDGAVPDFTELTQSFRDIAFFNRMFGGVTPLARAVGDAATVLDVGTGFADIPRAIVRQQRAFGRTLQITCLDASADVLEIARAESRDYPELSFVHAQGEALPFADGQFAAALCSLTLHHCEPPQAIALLRELARVAPRVIVGDLYRSYGGYAGASLISHVFSRNRLTRNDAPLSVRRAYTPAEALALAREAGWSNPTVRKTPFFRMLLRCDEASPHYAN